MPWNSQLLNIVLAKENKGILDKTCYLQLVTNQDFNKGNFSSMRRKQQKVQADLFNV